mmetsp:Transcript_45940/g.80280  ORF Transcript_45940/g.80280 Transcript_45940/m.80280 type:complete len:379 (+) Transcript_45940:1454-2590(+)
MMSLRRRLSRRYCSYNLSCTAPSTSLQADVKRLPSLSDSLENSDCNFVKAGDAVTSDNVSISLQRESCVRRPLLATVSNKPRSSLWLLTRSRSNSSFFFLSANRWASRSSAVKSWKVRRKSLSSMARNSVRTIRSKKCFLLSAQMDVWSILPSSAKPSSTLRNWAMAPSRSLRLSSFSFFSSSTMNSRNKSSRSRASSTFLYRGSSCRISVASLQRVRASISVFSASIIRKASRCLRAFNFCCSFSCFRRRVWYSASACFFSPWDLSASHRGSCWHRSCTSLILAMEVTFMSVSSSLKASAASAGVAYTTAGATRTACAAACRFLASLAAATAATLASAASAARAAATWIFFCSAASTSSFHMRNSSGIVHSDSFPLL